MKIIIKKLPLTFNLKRKLFKKHIKHEKNSCFSGTFIVRYMEYKASSFSFYKGFDLAFCLFSLLTLLSYLLFGIYLPISIRLCLFINCFLLAFSLLNPCKLLIFKIIRYGYSNYSYLSSLLCQIMIIILIVISQHSFYYLAFLMFILLSSQTPWYLILIGLITKTIKFILLQQDETWLNMKKNLQKYNKEIDEKSEIQITLHNLEILEPWFLRGYMELFPDEECFLMDCWFGIGKDIYYKYDLHKVKGYEMGTRIELHLKTPPQETYLESGGGLFGVFCVNGEWICKAYPVIEPVAEQLWGSKVHAVIAKPCSNGFTIHPIFTQRGFYSNVRNFLTIEHHKTPAFQSATWGTGLMFKLEDLKNVIKDISRLNSHERNLVEEFKNERGESKVKTAFQNNRHPEWCVDVQRFQNIQTHNPEKRVQSVLRYYLHDQLQYSVTQTKLMETVIETPAIIKTSLNTAAPKIEMLIDNIETETENLICFENQEKDTLKKQFLDKQIRKNQKMLEYLKN